MMIQKESFTLLNKKIYYIVLVLLSFIIVGFLLITFSYPSLGQDSGFYLKIAYDLTNGLHFFNKINCSYNPLAMYILSLPFYVFKDAGVSFMFVYFYLIYILIAIVFYKLLKFFIKDNKICVLLTVILITVNFILEGFHILLEPFVLLFQLLSLWFLLYGKTKPLTLFLSGLFLFLSFFSKQYGLFILLGIIYFIFYHSNSKTFFLKNFLVLVLGFILPAILIYFFIVENTLSVIEYIFKLLGISALKGEEIMVRIEYSTQGFLEEFWQFILKFPYFALVLYLFFKQKNTLKHSNWFTLLLLAGALSTLYFAYYDHYFQLITPYVILVILSLKKDFLFTMPKTALVFTLFFIVVSFIKLYERYDFKKNLYAEQLENTVVLSEHLPKESKVYLFDASPAHYFLNKYNSPNFLELGYKFSSELSLNTIINAMSINDFIVISNKNINSKQLNKFEKFSEITLKNKTNKRLPASQKLLILKKNE